MVIITGKQHTGKTHLLKYLKEELKLSDEQIYDDVSDIEFIFSQFQIENKIGANFYIATQIDLELLEKKFLDENYIPPIIIEKFYKNGIFSQMTHEPIF